MKAATQQTSTRECAEYQENIDRLRREIAGSEAEAAKLQAEFDSCSSKISQKQTEQRTLVVAARVRKDKSAQTQVDKLSEEVRRLQDENLQNYAAIEELHAIIEGKREAAGREERRLHYGAAVALVKRRTDGELEARLLKLIGELAETAKEIDGSDSEIATALYQLTGVPGADRGLLLREAQEFAYRQRRRVNTICEGLKAVLGPAVVTGGACMSGPGQAVQVFEKLVQMLSAEGNLDGQAA